VAEGGAQIDLARGERVLQAAQHLAEDDPAVPARTHERPVRRRRRDRRGRAIARGLRML